MVNTIISSWWILIILITLIIQIIQITLITLIIQIIQITLITQIIQIILLFLPRPIVSWLKAMSRRLFIVMRRSYRLSLLGKETCLESMLLMGWALLRIRKDTIRVKSGVGMPSNWKIRFCSQIPIQDSLFAFRSETGFTKGESGTNNSSKDAPTTIN